MLLIFKPITHDLKSRTRLRRASNAKCETDPDEALRCSGCSSSFGHSLIDDALLPSFLKVREKPKKTALQNAKKETARATLLAVFKCG